MTARNRPHTAMQIARLVRSLGPVDLKLIGRDRLLVMMFFFLAYIALVLRYGLPWLDGYLMETGVLPGEAVALRLADFYPLIVAFFVLFDGALLVGAIVGFVLIDEKDHRTLKALLVTPVPFPRYVVYRVGVPVALAFIIIIAMVYAVGVALPPPGPLLLLAAGAALTAPIASLFFAIFAENKVQGFAVAKFASIAGWVILLGWFVGEPFQWLLGVFPPFLISKAYWLVLEGDPRWGLALLAGIILQIALIALMARRFHQVAYR